MKEKLCLFLAAVLLICTAAAGLSESSGTDAESIRSGISAYNRALCEAENEQDWIAKGLKDVGSEWYVLSLKRLNSSADFSAYVQNLQGFVQKNTVASASTRLKYALTLVICGAGEDAFVTDALNNAIGKQGIMSWIFGLHLLNNGLTSAACSKKEVISAILEMRKADGGWAVSGDYADADVTAMALQALAPLYSENEAVRSAVDTALALLSEKQLESGGFQSYGVENPESTAQVIIALCSLGLDPDKDGRFLKNGNTMLDALSLYALPDGSFCHTIGKGTSGNATAQVYLAMTALKLLREGSGRLFIFETAQIQKSLSYKIIVCIVASALAAVICFILFLRGKRKFKNYIFVMLVLFIVCTFTRFTDFQTAENYYNGSTQKGEITGSVTITIRCDTIAGKTDSKYIPADGVILPVTEFQIDSDDTAYDILVEAARTCKIQMESSGTAYISGIQYIYEMNFGDLSGWVYHVNGTAPSVGCGEYRLKDGDIIEWLYTLDLGNDVKEDSNENP